MEQEAVKQEVTAARDSAGLMERNVVVKLEPPWCMEEVQPDQSSGQPVSDTTSGSLLVLHRSYACQRCSAAFALVSSLELHLASVHEEPLPYPVWTKDSDRHIPFSQWRLSTEETDNVGQKSAITPNEFVLKQEPSWSMEEDSADQPSAVSSTAQRSAVCSTTQPSAVSSTAQPSTVSSTALSAVSSTAKPSAASSTAQRSAILSTAPPMTDNIVHIDSLLNHDRRFVCQPCSAAFVLVGSLELHLASVHGDKLNIVLPGNFSIADIDKLVFCSSKRMIIKMKKKPDTGTGNVNSGRRDKEGQRDRKEHVCDICQKPHTTHEALKRHKHIYHKKNDFSCNVCNEVCASSTSLARHKLLHSDGAVVCDVCQKAFLTAEALERHKLDFHDNPLLSCKFCGQHSIPATKFVKHLKLHNTEGPYQCPLCDKSCISFPGFERHLNVKHLKWKGRTKETPYKCPHCDIFLKCPSSLQSHVRSKHALGLPCDVCGKKFSTSETLSVHKRVHDEDRPYKCQLCPSGFNEQSFLKVHIRHVHGKGKRFVCEICAAGYHCNADLIRHRRLHTKEKPYLCSDCGKSFPWHSSLRYHQSYCHSGARAEAKRHVCDICKVSFTSSATLRRHTRLHTGEKPYACSDCGNRFVRLEDLKHHRLTHTSEKPYACSDCGKRYSWPNGLRSHRQTHCKK